MMPPANQLPVHKTKPVVTRLAGIVLFVLLAAAMAYYAAFHARFITLPGAQEIREASIPLTTGLILAGGRPYSLSSSPAVTNVYGVVYNYLVVPAAKIWGPTFAVHRTASLLFLLTGAVLLYALLQKENTGRWLALAGAVFYYLFNATTYAIVARPDTLGNAIYLAVVVLVWPGPKPSAPSMVKLVVSVMLGVLAFYTKPYFVLALALAAAILFVSHGWRWALGYAMGATVLMAASIPVVLHFWPYYLFEVYTSHVIGESDPPGFRWMQAKDFLLLHAGLVLAVVGAGGLWLRNAFKIRFATPDEAARYCCPDASVICLIISLAALARIGGHSGAFRIYWVQLVSPFLILVAVRAVARSENHQKAAALSLLAINALILLTWARPAWPEDSTPAWSRWHQLTQGETWQLVPPSMLPDVQTGMPVIENGQMTYFANLALDQLPPDDPAYRRVLQYLLKVRELIWQRRFDVIVSPNDFRSYIPTQMLKEHYQPHLVIFPIYFADYFTPKNYGTSVRSYVAWVRKPGPEHAWQANLEAPPPAQRIDFPSAQ
jgi:hypothetical protein